MFKVMGIVILVLLVALGVTGKLLQSAYEDIGTLKANVAVAEQAARDQTAELLRAEALYEQERENVAALNDEVAQVRVDRDEAVSRLNSHRAQLSARALSDPEDLGDRATRATARVMEEAFRLTGGVVKEDVEDEAPTAD